MTFTAALSVCKPLRRTAWTKTDGPRINYETVFSPQWIVLGEVKDSLTRVRQPWIVIATGREVTLTIEDYLATDWEVQP